MLNNKNRKPDGFGLVIIVFLSFAHLHSFSQSFSEQGNTMGISHLHFDRSLVNGGAAILDFNNDNLLDIYLTSGEKIDHLYKNVGQGFEEVGIAAGLGPTQDVKTCGVVAGDIDNDGFIDLFITTEKSHKNILFINNGDGSFSDITVAAGISGEDWSSMAVFGDYNLDGFLDIFVSNYVDYDESLSDRLEEQIVSGVENYFFVNQGNRKFIDKSQELGLLNKGAGLGAIFFDYDKDNDLDIYLVNDFTRPFEISELYQNLFPKDSFSIRTEDSNTGKEINGMGVAIGDYNNDQWSDLYITDIVSNKLYRNNHNGTFTDKAITSKVECSGIPNSDNTVGPVSWGTVFFDYNNDTHLDLFVATGNMVPDNFGPQYHPNHLFKGDSKGGFEDVSVEEGFSELSRSRGVVYGDLDNDGDLDLVMANVDDDHGSNDKSWVFINNSSSNNWLQIVLQGTESNYSGFGSNVAIYSEDKHWSKELVGGSSYQSSNSRVIHFGLGDINRLDSVVVTWLGGKMDKIENVGVNQRLKIVEGQSITRIHDDFRSDFGIYPNPTTDMILIRSQDGNPMAGSGYSIFNLIGKLVKKGTVSNDSRIEGLGDLLRGTYLISIGQESKHLIFKIILE